MNILIVMIVILVVVVIIQIRRIDKLHNSVRWLLKHVHVVSQSNAADPELKQIKSLFGVDDDT